MSFGETARITAKCPVRRICRPENGTSAKARFLLAPRKTERPFARQAEDEVVAVKLVIICFYLFFLSFSGVNLYLFFVFAKFIAENFLFVAIF